MFNPIKRLIRRLSKLPPDPMPAPDVDDENAAPLLSEVGVDTLIFSEQEMQDWRLLRGIHEYDL